MTVICTNQREGRAFGRVLLNIMLVLMCLAGFALMAKGAIIPVKALAAQILLDRAFEQGLSQKFGVKPWPWADSFAVARLTLSRLGVRDIILSGGSGQAMAFGPTMLPGNASVRIMAAHRDTHFAFLKHVRTGDMLEVMVTSGQTRRYKMIGAQIVRWDRFAYPAHPARPLLALVTCYPFDAKEQGPLRYIVWAEEI